MRGPKRRRKRCGAGAGVVLAIAAFLGALMCLSFFSLKTVRGALHMKVVVVKSPKMFVGFLRLMFGIKKSEMT